MFRQCLNIYKIKFNLKVFEFDHLKSDNYFKSAKIKPSYTKRGVKTMKRIKWGVIGTAEIARSCTIPGMQQADNCELYAIAGRNIEKAEQFKEAFGFENAYGNYEELLNDPEVEAVYIALPNILHYE